MPTHTHYTSSTEICCKALLMFLLIVSSAPLLADNFTAYIKHSSGLVLGNNGADRAVLLAADDKAAVALEFVETNDGWMNIKLKTSNNTTQFLCKTGSWNASFVSSGNSDEAKFKIEGDMAALVKIKCKANSLYLGSDDTQAGVNVYSNKDGGDPKHTWFITSDLSAEPDLSTIRFELDPTALRQLNEGWGVSLCWWANMCGKWSDANIDKLIDWLVSPTGLNYNIFRYNIGGGDDPLNRNCTPHHMGGGKGLRAEMEGFKDSTEDRYHWDRDAAQRKIMLKIREKRPDAIFEAFSNTPPWYMTYSGCCSGNVEGGKDNLKPEYYEEFANYLVDVCKHYKEEYGIEFRTLEPFNEATTDYWHCSGVQEGCHFDFSSQIAFIKVLYPILKKSGLSTVISASDETAVWPAVCGFNEYKNAGILKMIGQWNTHTYWGSNNDRKTFSQQVRSTGKRLWMSETGSGGNGLGGNLSMAQRLIDDIRYMEPDAWVDWQYMEEKNDQWCTVQGSFSDQTFKKVKNYYVRQQFSRFISQGYTYIRSENEQTLAAVSPERDTLVFVTLNNTANETEYIVRLNGVKTKDGVVAYQTDESRSLSRTTKAFTLADNELTFKLPATSIRTFVIPMYNGKEDAIHSAQGEQLVSCRTTDGTLHIQSPAQCHIAVYRTNGTMAYQGTCHGTTAITLPAGIYLLQASTPQHTQTITIKL